MQLVWESFKSLNQTRTYSEVRANPISYSEILAWNILTETNISAKEIQILKILDNSFLVHLAKQSKE
jgi:hypothetical protein